MKIVPNQCPECGQEVYGQLQTIVSLLYPTNEDGRVREGPMSKDSTYEWTGDTEMDTMSTYTDNQNREYAVGHCGHHWPATFEEEEDA